MLQPSIKKNFAYKSVLTLSTYLINFITFPYVARVLGVERIGLVNFVDNTVNYFLLFATMGVGLLGVREIAAVKEDKKRRDQVYSSVLALNLLFTLVSLGIYLLCVVTIPKLCQYDELFYIGTAKILFTVFLVEWFFTGVENFRYYVEKYPYKSSLYNQCFPIRKRYVGLSTLFYTHGRSGCIERSYQSIIYSRIRTG